MRATSAPLTSQVISLMGSLFFVAELAASPPLLSVPLVILDAVEDFDKCARTFPLPP